MKRQWSTIKKIIARYTDGDDLFLSDEEENIFSANTGALLHDKNGELVAANSKAAEILNLKTKDLFQVNCIRDLWKTQNYPVPFEDTCFTKALKTGKPHSEIFVTQLKNGNECRIFFNSQPLFRVNEPEPFSVVTNIVDITGSKLPDKTKQKVAKEISESVIEVQEKERMRIGHELHDNVNQILSIIKLFLDILTPSADKEKMILDKSREYISTAIEEIRKLSQELVAPQLKEKSLNESIQRLIDDIRISSAIDIKFTNNHEKGTLSTDKKITIFRIVQEQLKNILRYSEAKHVDISLQYKDVYVELIIKDNGVGFDPGRAHRGIGLSNIYERSRFHDGTVDIQTAPGKGCTLTVMIPI